MLLQMDFTVSTEGGTCGYVNTGRSTLTSLVVGPAGPWAFMDTHPQLSMVLLASAGGLVVTYNYLTNEKVGEDTQLQLGEELTALKLAPDGHSLALGTR
jgi:hypothetical protein